jgi:hypothetical protein
MSDSCSVGDWDPTSDGSSGADWDLPFDDLNFAQKDLHSRSEQEAGSRAIRVRNHGAVRQLTVYPVYLAAWAVCSAV